MWAKKFSTLLALLSLFILFSCSSDNNEESAKTPQTPPSYQAKVIGGYGGAGVVGGRGADICIYPQMKGILLSDGEAVAPEIEIPAGATVIDADITWTDALNSIYANGFKINEGVTVTVPDDLADGGLVIYVQGPVVIEGNIVRGDNTTGAPVNVTIEAEQAVVIAGKIDVSGPDDDTGDGVAGGMVFINNDFIQDSIYGIYFTGEIFAMGGDATGTTGNGGAGGWVEINGGDNEDIVVSGTIRVDGGNGVTGVGNGGDAGSIIISNYYDSYPSKTPFSLGNIYFYDVDLLFGTGGFGETLGGSGGGFGIEADRGLIQLSIPLEFNGGLSHTGDGGGASDCSDIWSNYDNAEASNSADVIIESDIQIKGGNGVNGGLGGWLYIASADGHLFSYGLIELRGGVGGADGGGDGGYLLAETWNTGSNSENFWLVMTFAYADGGNGFLEGGNGGIIELTNYTDGPIYVNMNNLSVDAGRGGGGTDGQIIITSSP